MGCFTAGKTVSLNNTLKTSSFYLACNVNLITDLQYLVETDFLLAGSGAIFTAMISMEMLFSVTPIAAARGPAGMAAVCFCGTIGGFVFDRLRSGVPRSR